MLFDFWRMIVRYVYIRCLRVCDETYIFTTIIYEKNLPESIL